MSSATVRVDEFPGIVRLIEGSTPTDARTLARANAIPPGWHSSRSYRDHYGLVAVSPTRVGVDIEIIDPSVTPEAVLTQNERESAQTVEELCSWWSAKEALAKALGDARLYDPRRLATPALWQLGHEGRWISRSLVVPSGYVGWLVWERNSVEDATS